jgi:hypothetical protein
MTGPSHNRRRTLVVNKPMQARLILGTALLPAIALAAIAVTTAVYCSRLINESVPIDGDQGSMMPLFYLVLAFELMAAVFLMYSSLKMSHRVAGPAYRICRSLERLRSGDLAFSVSLRKGDHLVEIRDELNRVLDWLNQNPPPGCITRSMPTEQQELLRSQRQPASTPAAAAALDAVPAPLVSDRPTGASTRPDGGA